jgi:hypothetical protein
LELARKAKSVQRVKLVDQIPSSRRLPANVARLFGQERSRGVVKAR